MLEDRMRITGTVIVSLMLAASCGHEQAEQAGDLPSVQALRHGLSASSGEAEVVASRPGTGYYGVGNQTYWRLYSSAQPSWVVFALPGYRSEHVQYTQALFSQTNGDNCVATCWLGVADFARSSWVWNPVDVAENPADRTQFTGSLSCALQPVSEDGFIYLALVLPRGWMDVNGTAHVQYDYDGAFMPAPVLLEVNLAAQSNEQNGWPYVAVDAESINRLTIYDYMRVNCCVGDTFDPTADFVVANGYKGDMGLDGWRIRIAPSKFVAGQTYSFTLQVMELLDPTSEMSNSLSGVYSPPPQ